MGYLRFVVPEADTESGVAMGLFGAAYALKDCGAVSGEHRQVLRELLTWFTEHLATPDRFNRTSSRGYNRRQTNSVVSGYGAAASLADAPDEAHRRGTLILSAYGPRG